MNATSRRRKTKANFLSWHMIKSFFYSTMNAIIIFRLFEMTVADMKPHTSSKMNGIRFRRHLERQTLLAFSNQATRRSTRHLPL